MLLKTFGKHRKAHPFCFCMEKGCASFILRVQRGRTGSPYTGWDTKMKESSGKCSYFSHLFSASLPKSEMKHTKDNEMPGAE